jgi:hypothetical protein
MTDGLLEMERDQPRSARRVHRINLHLTQACHPTPLSQPRSRKPYETLCRCSTILPTLKPYEIPHRDPVNHTTTL